MSIAPARACPVGCHTAVPRSAPHSLWVVRVAGGVLLAAGATLAHLPGSVGLPCPLRTLTGVPCPFCGMTTSVRSILGGRWHDAFAANPFGLAVVLASAVALVVPWRATMAAARRVGKNLLAASAGLLLAGSWIFELLRYHVL